jgi:ribonuclease HII
MIYSDFSLETSLWSQGLNFICGVDEVGRGCFAGPVVAGAVIFPLNFSGIKGLADSKLLKPKIREELSELIKEKAAAWSIGEISVEIINKIGIGKATQMAFVQAVKNLKVVPHQILIDAFYIEELEKHNQRPIKGGDKLCSSIAAASIVAKVYRDKLMEKLHLDHPDYDFFTNKGYGTKKHRDALKKFGLSSLHRTSFNLNKFL